MSTDPALFQYLLRLGDNTLILGHRISEWCGHGPILEEDLALANVALDLIGQTKLWLGYAGEVEGRGRDADQLAYRRDASDFRNLLLAEQKNGDFARTMVRQFFFDAWHFHLLEGLELSSDEKIGAIASKAIREVTYHLERSHDWVVRLGDGTSESRQRMQSAIDGLWMYTGEMFELDDFDRDLIARKIAPDPNAFRKSWEELVSVTLEEATLAPPSSKFAQKGGRNGVHSEHLGHLLAEMQFLQRAYPDASW